MKPTRMIVMLALLASLCVSAAHAAAPYLLGVDDVVRVTVYGHPDLSTVARIAENGRINFPTIGEVALAGLTAREAELRLAEILLQRDVVKNPQVGLIVEQYQSKRVAVLGEVENPGVYAITRNSTVMDLISEAGGLSREAGNQAIVTSKSGRAGRKTVVDLAAVLEGRLEVPEPTVSDGDRIYVPSMERFYVYGEVNRPGAYRLERGMNVIQALSVAGGLTDKATKRGMTITRKSQDGSDETIPAQPMHGMQPDDVLYVKESLF